MSGDHNMNQTSSAWRKRQIALNKKAENARELGLDYEPDKTVIDMAREADVKPMLYDGQWAVTNLDKFAELVQAKKQADIETLYAMYMQACEQRDSLMDQQSAMVAAMRGRIQ